MWVADDSGSNELEQMLRRWIALPNHNEGFIGFFVTFKKGAKISDTDWLIVINAEFTGKVFPGFAHEYPEFYDTLQDVLDKQITRCFLNHIANNYEGLMNIIASGKIILSSNIFQISNKPQLGCMHCIQKYQSLTAQTEKQVLELGIFN